MQSPTKLRQRLDELLGPPGPESDPIELALRTVVQTTAPMIQGIIDQWEPDQLDHGLELVALFFLAIRSDEALISDHFLQELARLNTEAAQHARTVPGTAAPVAPAAIPPPPADPTPPDTTKAGGPASPGVSTTEPPEDTSSADTSVSDPTKPDPEPAPAAAPPPGFVGHDDPVERAPAPAAPAADAPPAQRPPAPPWG